MDSYRILIVEDDRFLADLYLTKLDLLGFDVHCARDGADAMERIDQQDYDLVLLDLLLPKISGFEVIKKIRRECDKKSCHIIILSNLSQPEEIDKGLELGANEYFVKADFTPQEIIDKITAKLK